MVENNEKEKKKKICILAVIIGIIVLIIIILSLIFALKGKKKPKPNPVKEYDVEFVVVVPVETHQVFVIGSFNDWDFEKAFKMSKADDDKWKVSITLKENNYEYKYVNGLDFIYVEKDVAGLEISNRQLVVGKKAVKVNDIVGSWARLWEPTPINKDNENISNILSNQFYYETDKQIFYTTTDELNHNHIYMFNKEDDSLSVIFHGFGWNLLVIEEWLYFTGNPGITLDNTYKLYRVKTDGSLFEKLNDAYSQKLFSYDNKLYYLQQDETFSSSYHLYSLDLNTLEIKEVYRFCKNAIVYKDRFYFIDNSGNLISYNSNMEEPNVLLQADVKMFTIYQDIIVYISNLGYIKTYNMNDKSINTITREGTVDIYTINVYKDKIYFSEIDLNSFNYEKYAYEVKVKSINLDGENEVEVLNYYSLGSYINIMGDRIYFLEQKRHDTVDGWTALYASSVFLSGEGYYRLSTEETNDK